MERKNQPKELSPQIKELKKLKNIKTNNIKPEIQYLITDMSNQVIINGRPITNSAFNFFNSKSSKELQIIYKEINFHISNLCQRKETVKYFMNIKEIEEKNILKEKNKQKMIIEDTTDDIYFPSLSEVAKKIENNEDLNLQRKRTFIIENDDEEDKENKKQIVEINGQLFVKQDDKFIKYEQ